MHFILYNILLPYLTKFSTVPLCVITFFKSVTKEDASEIRIAR